MKTVSINKLVGNSKKLKKENKLVGVVVGSFDVVHLGHLNLFRFAKEHVDFLIVGLDHDDTIRKTKGETRPINTFEQRSEFLTDLQTIDSIFLIENISTHGSEKSLGVYEDILKKIKPTHVFTHKACDRHWREKKKIAKELDIVLILDESERVANSGEIISKLKL